MILGKKRGKALFEMVFLTAPILFFKSEQDTYWNMHHYQLSPISSATVETGFALWNSFSNWSINLVAWFDSGTTRWRDNPDKNLKCGIISTNPLFSSRIFRCWRSVYTNCAICKMSKSCPNLRTFLQRLMISKEPKKKRAL